MNKLTKTLLSLPLLLSTVACTSTQANEFQSDSISIRADVEHGIVDLIYDYGNHLEVNIYGPRGVDYTNFRCNNGYPMYVEPDNIEMHDTRMNGEQFTQTLLGKFCSAQKNGTFLDNLMWGV